MLILRMGEASLHDDGLIDAIDRSSVDALTAAWRLLEQEQLRRAAASRARCRQARARAIRRAHRAGLALSARRHVALSSALAAAAVGLKRDLHVLVDQRMEALLAAHGPTQWLLPELVRCLDAASPQPVLTIRVCAAHLSLVQAWTAETRVDVTPQVVADTSLSPTCCVVETATGIVRGCLTSQLHAVRQGLGDAASSTLDDLFAQWTLPP